LLATAGALPHLRRIVASVDARLLLGLALLLTGCLDLEGNEPASWCKSQSESVTDLTATPSSMTFALQPFVDAAFGTWTATLDGMSGTFDVSLILANPRDAALVHQEATGEYVYCPPDCYEMWADYALVAPGGQLNDSGPVQLVLSYPGFATYDRALAHGYGPIPGPIQPPSTLPVMGRELWLLATYTFRTDHWHIEVTWRSDKDRDSVYAPVGDTDMTRQP
jgi:hypothetical protein